MFKYANNALSFKLDTSHLKKKGQSRLILMKEGFKKGKADPHPGE